MTSNIDVEAVEITKTGDDASALVGKAVSADTDASSCIYVVVKGTKGIVVLFVVTEGIVEV